MVARHPLASLALILAAAGWANGFVSDKVAFSTSSSSSSSSSSDNAGEYATSHLGWCVLPASTVGLVSNLADIWSLDPVSSPRFSSSSDGLLNATMLVDASVLPDVVDAARECSMGRAGEMQRLVEAERQRISSQSSLVSDLEPDTFFKDFRPYAQIAEYSDSLQAKLSKFTQRFVISKTFEGRPIYSYKISSGGSKKPVVYLQAQQHAREWLATPTLLYFWTSLVEGYLANDPTYVNLIKNIDFIITPQVNIDGYIFTWEKTRLWRKNRRLVSGSTYGVDLNRNWGPESTWCTKGSSRSASSDTFCGSAPFSEPELVGIKSLLDELASNGTLAIGVDYHTYGPLLLHPYQYTVKPLPDVRDREKYATLGKKLQDVINSVNKAKFVAEQGSELYEHSGGLIDYVHEITSAKALAWTFELRGSNFVVAPTEIVKSGEEITAGMLYLLSLI